MTYTPETIAKFRAAKLGRKHKPSHNEAIREGVLKSWAKRNPIRFRFLPPDLKYYVRKLYKSGIHGDAVRKALEENA